MNATQIEAKINAGRSKAALRIGFSYKAYRPQSAINPLLNQVATLSAAFNSGDNKYLKPNSYGDAIWYADVDGSQLQVGDYLIKFDGSVSYFIAGLQSLLPILAVGCNRLICITQINEVQSGSFGVAGYGGAVASSNAPSIDLLGKSIKNSGSFTGWPCSILYRTGKQLGNLTPGSVGNAEWSILLPASVPIVISQGDHLTDDLNRNYLVTSSELSDLGWRLTATEEHY